MLVLVESLQTRRVCMWLAPRRAHCLIKQVKEVKMHLSASTIPMVMRSGYRQFGTSDVTEANDVFADSLGVYVVGRVQGSLPDQTNEGRADAFIRKYNSDGDEEWNAAVWDIRI